MASRKDNRGRVLKEGEYQRSDGRYQFSYTDRIGKRRYMYANDLATLREKERKKAIDELNGIDTYLASITTLNQMFDKYLSTKAGLKNSTRASYVQMYDRYVRDEFGENLIKKIKYSDIKRFYCQLMKERGIGVRSVEYVHMMLSPAFEMAVRDDIILKNPAKGVLGDLKRALGYSTKKRHALTIDEQKIFLEFMDGHPVWGRYHSIFQVMVGTGLRVGELAGLRWEDVDFEKRSINVNHGIVSVKAADGKKEHIEVSDPKTDCSVRNVPITDRVLDAFKEEFRYAESRGFPNCEIDGFTDFIFTKQNGTVYTSVRLDKALSDIVESYNKQEIGIAEIEERDPVLLPKFSNHILRHTFCTRLCERDVNIKTIQTVMGHKNIKITMDIYAEVSNEKVQSDIEKLARELDIF